MSKIKIGVFDDHPVISTGISSFLANQSDEIEISLIASTIDELMLRLETIVLDVLVMDIVAPDVNGLELFVDVIKKYNSIKIIGYSTLRSPVLVENLLSIGVKGFVNKAQPIDDLMKAIKDVNYDLVYVPEKYKFLTSRYRESGSSSLTEREMDILKLIAREDTTQQIADALGLSPKTIENHKINLFKKMNVKNAAGLILAATRLGYIS